MRVQDYIVLAIVLLSAAFAVFVIVRNRKKGKGCCGSCPDCGKECEKREERKEEGERDE